MWQRTWCPKVDVQRMMRISEHHFMLAAWSNMAGASWSPINHQGIHGWLFAIPRVNICIPFNWVLQWARYTLPSSIWCVHVAAGWLEGIKLSLSTTATRTAMKSTFQHMNSRLAIGKTCRFRPMASKRPSTFSPRYIEDLNLGSFPVACVGDSPVPKPSDPR